MYIIFTLKCKPSFHQLFQLLNEHFNTDLKLIVVEKMRGTAKISYTHEFQSVFKGLNIE